MDRWRRMISEQGGDPDAPLPVAAHTEDVRADSEGYIQSMDALAVGVSSWRLGAGRARKEDPVQAEAGIEILAKPGDFVRAGQPIFRLHTQTPERFERAIASLEGAVVLGANAPTLPDSVVLDRAIASLEGAVVLGANAPTLPDSVVLDRIAAN